MNDKNEQTPNVYKTSKTTWLLLGFLVVIAGIVIFMMMRKNKEGAGAMAEMGAGIPTMPTMPTMPSMS
jgi:hypothetical protein